MGMHNELYHMGGRDALLQALVEVGTNWVNLPFDAQWIVHRCEECRQSSARGLAESELRPLLKSGAAGEAIGFDLKQVVPHNAEAWLMLLAVDLTTNRVFAGDLDIGHAQT